MSSEKDSSLIKTPRQLITLIVLAFVVPVILIILLATFVAGQRTEGAGTDAMTVCQRSQRSAYAAERRGRLQTRLRRLSRHRCGWRTEGR
jgi:hypothetical protein